MAMSVGYRRKRALIIGINEYQHDQLRYCINDAKDLKATLKRIGFDVSLGLDCNLSELYDTIDTFTKTIERDDLVLFYFAGLGKQNNDENYLLPADYDYDHRGHERDYITKNAVNVKHLVKNRGPNSNQGLSPMHAPSQTLIVFACAPGKAVLDETRNNRNGSFIENLLKYITTPDKDIEDVMKKVAGDVNRQTGGVQLPYRTSSLTGEVCLVTNNDQEAPPLAPSRNMKLYSDEKIRCRGLACKNCGRCRDWYWRHVNNKMRHIKRNDAICALMDINHYDSDGAYRENDYHSVCQCDDNRA